MYIYIIKININSDNYIISMNLVWFEIKILLKL